MADPSKAAGRRIVLTSDHLRQIAEVFIPYFGRVAPGGKYLRKAGLFGDESRAADVDPAMDHRAEPAEQAQDEAGDGRHGKADGSELSSGWSVDGGRSGTESRASSFEGESDQSDLHDSDFPLPLREFGEAGTVQRSPQWSDVSGASEEGSEGDSDESEVSSGWSVAGGPSCEPSRGSRCSTRSRIKAAFTIRTSRCRWVMGLNPVVFEGPATAFYGAGAAADASRSASAEVGGRGLLGGSS